MKRAAALLVGVAIGVCAARRFLKPKPRRIPPQPEPPCLNCGAKAYQLFGGWCWQCEDAGRK